jgi:hypothetical protein
LREL